jgi:hypothetical protein
MPNTHTIYFLDTDADFDFFLAVDDCLDCGGDCDERCGVERWTAPMGEPTAEVDDTGIDHDGLAI